MRALWQLVAATIVMLTGVAGSSAPPPIRPLDVVMIHGINETTRTIHRDMQELDPEREKLRTRVIVIDPGHGGENLGAVGVADLREKLLTLELAYALRGALEAKYPDVRVLMTRYWDRDVDLFLRTRWANAQGAELFLSLHYNAAGHDRALGYETFFLSEERMAELSERGRRAGQKASRTQRRAFRKLDRARVVAHRTARKPLISPHEQSKLFATLVQAELAARLESINRGVKQADFAVLRGAMMPAVVIESGFLTHPIEGRTVFTVPHRDAVVEALVAAIEAYDAKRPARTETAKPAVSSAAN